MTYDNSNITFAVQPIHPNFQDLTGDKYGRLTVLGLARIKPSGHKHWHCLCECGTLCEVSAGNLRNGHTTSYSCYGRANLLRVLTKHGESGKQTKTPEYKAYCRAKMRCVNPKAPRYADYGGRGIEFRFKSYTEFLNHIGRKPTPQHSLDRINNDGHYEVGNVRWATDIEQGCNKRGNRWITYDGKTLILNEWVRFFNAPKGRIEGRLYSGWCVPCAFTFPKGGLRCQHKNQPSIIGSDAALVTTVLV